MSDDFLAGVSQEQLNQLSTEIFPSIREKLTQTSTIGDFGVTLTWAVTSPPSFVLSQFSTNQFEVVVLVCFKINTPQEEQAPENITARGRCEVTISGEGRLGILLSDLSLEVSDLFTKQILNSKKPEIIAVLDQYLSAIEIPLGPVEGVTFLGYATQVRNGVLYAAASVSGDATIDRELTIGSGFGISISNALMQIVVLNTWWAGTPKSFRPHKDVTIHLNSYSFEVANGQLTLYLRMSGEVKIDTGIFGTARWSLSISTVVVNIEVGFDDDLNVVLSGGSVSRPDISADAKNLAAKITKMIVPMGTITASLVEEKIPGSIRDHLSGTVYTVPVLSEAYEGVAFTVTPCDLSLDVDGSLINVYGSAVLQME